MNYHYKKEIKMRNIYLVLEKMVDKIFSIRILIKVVKVTFIVMFLLASFVSVASKSVIIYFILALFVCLFYIFLYVINDLLKNEEEYLLKILKK
jgi:4-hydroxybenzoate polyprenyltransferase